MTSSAVPRTGPARGLATALGRVARGLSRICGVAAALMIVAAVLITCQLIFMRFVMNASTIWQTEAVTYLMIGATLLGLPYVQVLRGHVNVDLLPLMLPPVARRILMLVTALATLAIAVVMVVYGWELFRFAWDRGWRSDTIWGVKLWIPYIALPVGFGLYALQLLADLIDPVAAPAEGTLGATDDPTEQERADAGEKAALRPAGEGN